MRNNKTSKINENIKKIEEMLEKKSRSLKELEKESNGGIKMKSYRKMARDDAIELIQEYFKDEIVEQLSKNGRASDDIYNDYANGDKIFHEVIIDRDYNPYDAVILLNELSEYQEDDRGLWEGLTTWDSILATIAAFTYGNAVMAEWQYYIKHINEVGKYDSEC